MQGDLLGQPDKPSILVISETARVTGQVQADHVIINGQVTGR
jgi:cytoskeletal protein CcmA (bactofilin family)